MLPDLANIIPHHVQDLIRVGRENDGGYVLSQRTIESATLLIGLGINTDWSFEADFLNRSPSTRLVAVDGSVSRSQFFKEALWHSALSARHLLRGNIHRASSERAAAKQYLSLRRQFGEFFIRPDRVFVEKMLSDADGWTGAYWDDLAATCKRLDTSATPRWFVKMDIEGAEYRVLPELMKNASLISGMVVEFHDCDLLAERFNEIICMLQAEFVVVHVHGNNHAPLAPGSSCPRVLELSFMNSALVTPAELSTPNRWSYPLDIDQPNRAGVADYAFMPQP